MPTSRQSEGLKGAIAIIGAAGRFPGADDLDAFWELLAAGTIAATNPGSSRAELVAIERDPTLAQRVVTLKAGYLRDVESFDARYFGISPREAAKMDPQQRLLLEVTHDALEDAGLRPSGLRGSEIGVYVGAGSSDYMTLDSGQKREIDGYFGVGNSHNLLAGRLSYHYDLKGPSVSIDTACSSSLTALHLALAALRDQEVELAIVGGVNTIVSPDLALAFSQAKMLSPSGQCKTFASDADGYGRAEAAGVVILQPAEAVPDAGRIRCLVHASGTNQDGRSNGITAPNGTSQRAIIDRTLRRAGIAPDRVGYLEAHGTGTALGDAIELRALGDVFKDAGPVVVGSAKASIGHAEAAAGICGLLKGMLMLEHGAIPPHPVGPPYNTALGDLGQPLSVSRRLTPLDPARPFVGVSSFGFGGSNAHVVLGPSPLVGSGQGAEVAGPAAAGGPALVLLSSHFEQGLRCDAEKLAGALGAGCGSLQALAAELAFHRDPLPCRRALVASESGELAQALKASSQGACPPERAKLVFMFAGQGSQYAAMGLTPYRRSPAYRVALDACAEQVGRIAGVSMRRLLLDPETPADVLFDDTHRAQLALFSMEYALASAWIDAGIRPDLLIGHSLGELAAHAVAGALSLDEAVWLVHERGRLMQACTGEGAMLSVALDAESLSGLCRSCGPGLAIGADNGRRSAVVSGPPGPIDELVVKLEGRGLRWRRLRARHAFHSPSMARAGQRLRAAVAGLVARPAEIPVVGNLRGELVSPGELTPDYWAAHVVSTVRFRQGLETLRAQGANVFVEIGPGRTLSALVGQDCPGVPAISSLEARDPELAWLRAAGSLFELGWTPDPVALGTVKEGAGARLPARALRRERHWTARARDTPPHNSLPQAKAASAVGPDPDPGSRMKRVLRPSWA